MPLSLAAILLSAAGVAHAGSVTADADTYVQRDNSGPHGSEPQIFVKNAGSGWATRKGLIRFVVPTGGVSSANLALDVSSANNGAGGSTTATIYVWGIKDGSAASCGESFSETSVLYNSLSFLDDSSDGVIDGSACLHDGDPAQAGVQMLGSFVVSGADVGNTVTFSSAALADFMSKSTNGVVTLALTRAENVGALNTGFASSQHATLKPPRLSWIPEESYTAASDTFVRHDNSEGYGYDQHIHVKNTGGTSVTRKGAVRFAGVAAGTFADASLSMDVSYHTAGTKTSTVWLWGIKDGVSSCGEGFSESWLSYNDLPFLDDSPDGIVNSSSCLHRPGALASVVISAADVGKTVTFRSAALVELLNANQNGNVTFVMTRQENDSDLDTAFASKEHATLSPPRLSVTRANAVAFVDGDPTPQGNGTHAYTGALHLPLAGAGAIVVPSANVVMTLDAQGGISTISGTVGYPKLPSVGLWGAMGDITGTAPYMTIGYDYGSTFDNYGLPLDESAKYFYFVASSAANVSWGPMSMDAPGAAGLLLAVDPATPAVFTHMDQDGTFLPVSTSSDFGFSNGNNIPFEPVSTWGVASHMGGFSGDVYMGGSMSLPLDIDNVDVSVWGDTTVEINQENFSANQPDQWIQSLGANAGVTAELSVGPFAVSYDVAQASVLYRRDTPSVAFSAVFDPNIDFVGGLPFMPKGSSGKLAGYLSNSVSSSYVDFEGEYKFGGSFAKQKIQGFAHLTASGGTFGGTAKFSGTTITVAGGIYSSYATFSGSIDNDWNVNISGVGATVKTTINTSFDSRNISVSLSGSAKVCGSVPGVLNGCDSIHIDELSVNAGGQLKICVDVPVIGTKCDTLN